MKKTRLNCLGLNNNVVFVIKCNDEHSNVSWDNSDNRELLTTKMICFQLIDMFEISLKEYTQRLVDPDVYKRQKNY